MPADYTIDQPRRPRRFAAPLIGRTRVRPPRSPSWEPSTNSKYGPHLGLSVLAGFRDGGLQVVTAAQVLDEGVDVPAADLAVILAASQSRRQMIQRMGRVLRRKPDGRPARFVVVQVEGTIEDPAYGAHEGFLDEVTGVADGVRRFRSGPDADALNAFLT